jgi:hypothetical protein
MAKVYADKGKAVKRAQGGFACEIAPPVAQDGTEI